MSPPPFAPLIGRRRAAPPSKDGIKNMWGPRFSSLYADMGGIPILAPGARSFYDAGMRSARGTAPCPAPRRRMSLPTGAAFLLLAGLAQAIAQTVTPDAAQTGPWPARVDGWDAVQPGEHPRLLFRREDVALLRQRALSPPARDILARLRTLLNGSNGETLPLFYNASTNAYAEDRPVLAAEDGGSAGTPAEPVPGLGMPLGSYTIGHVAGYGLLFQLTGERKYADLGRRCFEQALDGARDRDGRYAWRHPAAPPYAGATLGWYALGYDLCYEGWEPAFRTKIAAAIQNYSGGLFMTLDDLAAGRPHRPDRYHFPAEVGGAAMALLAVRGDAGVDARTVDPLLAVAATNTLLTLRLGFGRSGLFREGHGAGDLAANTVFVPALQAWRGAGGLDFIAPRPNAPDIALLMAYELLPRNGQLHRPYRSGGYGDAFGTEIFDRLSLAGGGQFAQGFGLLQPGQASALLWTYREVVEPAEQAGIPLPDGTIVSRAALRLRPDEKTFDAVVYPHRAVLAFLNWPRLDRPRNPGEILPRYLAGDGYFVFRNRWRDAGDSVVAVRAAAHEPILLCSHGLSAICGRMPGSNASLLETRPDGSAVIGSTIVDSHVAIDFSGLSGAEVLVVVVGRGIAPGERQAPAQAPAAAGDYTVNQTVIDNLHSRQARVCTLQNGSPPAVRREGDQLHIGGRTVRFNGMRLFLEP